MRDSLIVMPNNKSMLISEFGSMSSDETDNSWNLVIFSNQQSFVGTRQSIRCTFKTEDERTEFMKQVNEMVGSFMLSIILDNADPYKKPKP